MAILDLSLKNSEIYDGINIDTFGGRSSFDINQENLNIIGENIEKWLKNNPERDEIILTGATAIPVYLTAFHAVVHRFHIVKYKNELYEIIVAKH